MRSLPLIAFAFAAAVGATSAARAADAAPLPSAPYTGDRLIAELTRLLAAHFKTEGDLEIDPVRTWTAPAAAATTWQLAVTEFPSQPSATMVVHFRLLADGISIDEESLLVRACLWRDAWFARHPLVAHSTFDPVDLESRRVDALRDRDALPATAGDDSMLLTRDLPADHLLTWHDVARRPLVRRGEIVEVTASEGMLSVSMKALAMENGARGDLITVRNLESRKDISALVVADNRVEVHF